MVALLTPAATAVGLAFRCGLTSSATASPSYSRATASLWQAQGRHHCQQRTPALASSSIESLLDRRGLGSSSGGAGVLEKPPALDTSWLERLYQTDTGGEGAKEGSRKRTGGGDQYRVLLVDSEKHTEEKVAKVIPQVVPAVTPDQARGVFHESKQIGVGIVCVAPKEHAEFYSQMMLRNGLSSRIEPDTDTI